MSMGILFQRASDLQVLDNYRGATDEQVVNTL